MRTAALAYGGGLITIMLIAIISVITMKSSYAELIAMSLENSIEYSIMMTQANRVDWESNPRLEADGESFNMRRSVVWQDWTDDDENEVFKRDFVSRLADNIDARVNSLDVEFYGADSEYGLLSVKVTANFSYPGGTEDSVSRTRTVILDKTIP